MAKKIEILENTLLKLLVRRGTDTDRRNISLSEGELGYTTDTERLFIGNGQPGGVVAGNRYLGSDSDPSATFTTALTGDLVFDTNTKSLCAFKGSGVWERVSSLTESTGDIDVSVDAGDILTNACGRNMQIDGNGRIETKATSKFNKIETINTDFLSIPRKLNLFDGTSSQSFTFPTNALGGKYLRTDAGGNLTWEDPVGAAEFFYNSENGPIPVGAVLPFTAGGVIPTGYIVCNGQEVSQTTYSDLFNVIGTNYGTTNPGASFKVPDYSLSTLYGVDSDPHNAQVYKVGADVNLGGTSGPAALVNFDGGATGTGDTGPQTIRSSNNIASVVKTANGKYTVTFIAPMSDANYIVAGTSKRGSTNRGSCVEFDNVTDATTTTYCKIRTISIDSDPKPSSSELITVAFFDVNASGGTSGTTITQEGFGSYSSGWVNSGDNSVTVANGAKLLFNHNLGSSELIFSYYVADDANGTNAQQLNDLEVWKTVGYNGALIDNVTSTSFELQLGSSQSGTTGYYTPETVSQDVGGIASFAGKYIKVVAIAADAVVSTPSTQSPLSAQGTIYVIKAIPDTVTNPTLTVVSPLTATVDGVNKTNTAFSPLVGDIVIGQPDAAEAVPPGVEAFDTAGTDTFTTKTQYTKFYVTGSGATGGNRTGGAAATIIGYLDLPIGTTIDMQVGAGISGSLNEVDGNYSNISIGGTELVRSLGGIADAFAGQKSSGTVANDARIISSHIIPGGATGVDTDNDGSNNGLEEGAGASSFWGAQGVAGAGGGSTSNVSIGGTGDGMVMFEWVDTVSGGTGGGAEFGTVWTSVVRAFGESGSLGTIGNNSQTTTYTNDTGYYLSINLTTSGDDGRHKVYCVFGDIDYNAPPGVGSLLGSEWVVVVDSQNTGDSATQNKGSGSVIVPPGKKYTFFAEADNTGGIDDINFWELRGPAGSSSGGTGGGLRDPNHAGGTIDVTTSFQDLDLSSIVGSNKAQVTIEASNGSSGCNLYFRRKGSLTDPYNAGNNGGWGTGSVTTGPSNDGGTVTVVTDSTGTVQYKSDGTSNGVEYKVLTYQVIS